jgi:hypothetical protein
LFFLFYSFILKVPTILVGGVEAGPPNALAAIGEAKRTANL